MKMHPLHTHSGKLLALVALASISLCSCRAMPFAAKSEIAPKEAPAAVAAVQAPLAFPVRASSPVIAAAYSPPALPQGAWTGEPSGMPQYAAGPGGHAHHGQCDCCRGEPGEFHFSCQADHFNCAPDGLPCPWPRDEYLCDGGDRNQDVRVKQDWSVVGLDQEDTVAHYDTLDGKTEISRSNKVCIYAPRFAAVRRVSVPIITEAHERMMGVEKADKLNLHADLAVATTAIQPEAPQAEQSIDPAITFRQRRGGMGLNHTATLALTRDNFMPYEDFHAIRRGVFEAHEKLRLAEKALAAEVWLDKKAVQVVIEDIMCVEATGITGTQSTHVYELEGKPRLRITKVASKADAKPGEVVDFTLRFDNVGEQPVGNVTIIDNLTTRLEYVKDSQSCTLKSEFKTQENPGESLVLRWEIGQPLKVNEGGIIRFQCRVR